MTIDQFIDELSSLGTVFHETGPNMTVLLRTGVKHGAINCGVCPIVAVCESRGRYHITNESSSQAMAEALDMAVEDVEVLIAAADGTAILSDDEDGCLHVEPHDPALRERLFVACGVWQ